MLDLLQSCYVPITKVLFNLFAFELFLEPCRKRTEDTFDPVWSEPLRIPMQQHIFSGDYWAGYGYSSRILDIDLKAQDNT